MRMVMYKSLCRHSHSRNNKNNNNTIRSNASLLVSYFSLHHIKSFKWSPNPMKHQVTNTKVVPVLLLICWHNKEPFPFFPPLLQRSGFIQFIKHAHHMYYITTHFKQHKMRYQKLSFSRSLEQCQICLGKIFYSDRSKKKYRNFPFKLLAVRSCLTK